MTCFALYYCVAHDVLCSFAVGLSALLNPKTPIVVQESLNSEPPGDSKIAFLHWRDVLELHTCSI